jgi:hypothetical protein
VGAVFGSEASDEAGEVQVVQAGSGQAAAAAAEEAALPAAVEERAG